MFQEFINRIDKILPVGGGVGTSVTYLVWHGVVLNNINLFLNQCIVTFLLAVIGGIGGWIGGYAIKRLYGLLKTKKWFKKILKIKEDNK